MCLSNNHQPSSSRSALMSRVRGTNTRPELIIRTVLHRNGFRFRLHRKDLPGSPDIVFPSLRKIIFVHGCYWHRHSGCKRTTTPKTNVEFWLDKFQTNIARDRQTLAQLSLLGWDCAVVWECQTDNITNLTARLLRFLGKSNSKMQRHSQRRRSIVKSPKC
jgi:DNA mismatch endonuclease, patch repair protein